MSVKSVISMDGGGTHLRVTAISGSRQLRKSYQTGVNLTAVSMEYLISIFSMVKSDLWIPDVIVAAFSGAGDPERKDKLSGALKTAFCGASIEVIMDIEGLYRAAVGSGRGVVVISGTGSTVYGHDDEGSPVRSGGWGHIFDDEGSGFWMSREIITCALRYREGLLPHDPIFDQLLEFYSVESIEKLVNLTIIQDFKTKIASFSKVALEQPTPLVKEIVDEGIGLLARRTLKVLEKTGPVDSITVHGGSFQSTYYRERFTRALGGHKISLYEGNVDEILAKQVFDTLNRS